MTAEAVSGKTSLVIRGTAENSVGFAEQVVPVQFSEVKILFISASISTEEVVGKGAGLNVGIYDKNEKLIATKDMGGTYSLDWFRGSAGPKSHSIAIILPREAVKMKIGAILYGKGVARFSDYRVVVEAIAGRRPSRLAREYLNDAARIIMKNSLVRDSIKMRALKGTALKIAGPAKTHRECFLAVEYLLDSLRPLGDEHSFLMKANELKNWKIRGSEVSEIQNPSQKMIGVYGYILVPAFHGGNPKEMLAFADAIQHAVEELLGSGAKGWIIDLRGNTGGNMAPMIAGLGPLFSSPKLGSLIDVDGKRNSWYYKDGRYFWDDDKGWKVSRPVVLQKSLPIAVLIGPQTGSSGEAVAISLIGNERTRTFGKPTWGLTTGNGSFELKDGSQIFLASTIMADRSGKKYTASIEPEFRVPDAADPNASDEVMSAAVEYLKSQIDRIY